MVGTSGTRSRPIQERAAPLEREKSSDMTSVSPGKRSRYRRRHRKQGAKRAILRASGIPTGRSRRRGRIDELESKVAFMESERETQMSSLRADVRFLRREVGMLEGMHLIRYHERRELEQRFSELEERSHQSCMFGHQDWNKRVLDLEHETNKLKAHPEHWHVTALRRAMEDLRAWVVESRRAGMSWSLAGNSAVGEECSELSEELSELDVSAGFVFEDYSASTGQGVLDEQNDGREDGNIGSGLQDDEEGTANLSSGAAGAVQSAALDQDSLSELKQKVEKFEEDCRDVEVKVEVKMESVAEEIREQLRVVQSMLASGGSSDLASWTSRVQGLEANYHWGMTKIDSRVAQLEYEIKVAKSEAEKTTEQADGASRREPTSETRRQGTDAWGAGEYSVKSVPERFAGEVQHCRRHIRQFVELELERAVVELRERGKKIWQANR